MSEKQIENAILRYLEAVPGCFAWKNQSTGIWDPIKKVYRKSNNKYHINGVSDIVGIYCGRPLFIEVKTPQTIKRKPEHQVWFIEQVKKYGAIAFFAASLEDVRQELEFEKAKMH